MYQTNSPRALVANPPRSFIWKDSIKKFSTATHRYSKRVSPYDKNSIAIIKHKYTKKPTKINTLFIKNALQSIKNQAVASITHQQEEVSAQSPLDTPDLSISEQETESDELPTPSISSAEEGDEEGDNEEGDKVDNDINSLELEQAIQELSSSLSTFASSMTDDSLVIEQALDRIASVATTGQNDILGTAVDPTLFLSPDVINSANNISSYDANPQEELFSSVEIYSRASFLKRTATVRLTRAASKGQVGLKRAATWLGLPVQKILNSSQVQHLGMVLSQSGGNLLKLASSHHLKKKDATVVLGQSVHSLGSSVLTEEDNDNYDSEEEDSETEDDDYVEEHEETVMRPDHQAHTLQLQKKSLFTEELVYGTDSDHFAFLKNQLGQKKSTAMSSSPASNNNRASINNKKTLVTPKRIMYCRVMQIINLASTRDCEYELHIQLNNVTMATKRGTLRKTEKNMSADRPQEEALAFEVEEPFSLNFIVAARHTNNIIRDGLAKIGIWPTATTTSTSANKDALSHTKLPIAGFTSLNFENKLNVLDQGVSRFRLTKPVDKPSNRFLNIELLIDVKMEEVLPAVVHRFPWSYTTNEYSAAVSYESSIDENLGSDPAELAKSRRHCALGDYLTIYTRGLAHPTWKRYWVTMEENQIVLHDFTFKDAKEPASIIPLSPLRVVNKPSMDDCENVGIARKTGIMLQFDRSCAVLSEPVTLESDEQLEGKAYLYGDSEQNAIHWRRTLSAYITGDKKDIAPTGAFEEGVDLRFLW